MKLVSLNIQGGAQGEAFFKYVEKIARSADILCFQEVYDSKKHVIASVGEQMNILSQLTKKLKGFNTSFHMVSSRAGEYFGLKDKAVLGLAIYVKKGIKTGKHFGKHVEGTVNGNVDFRNGKEANAVQCLEIITKTGNFWVMNFHGQSRPGNKLDTPKRLRQSKILAGLIKKLKGPKILCGDFNLMPKTESVRIVERAGLKNLITIYKIKNTRNSVSWKSYGNRQYFADFTFVSPELKVKKFKVPYNLASDHLPMVLEFSL
ncbi:MAG: endonuclease/exonuclease/phosphatase family protein [Patescibacteria group bacterium]|nr:endonuclease/exonuclease/phosphatase family protein [Patescibacteria group bacterium]